MRKIGLVFTIIISLGGATIAYANDLTTTHFILRDSAITVIGGQTTSTNFQNITAGGQTIIGAATSTNFTNQSGILYFTLPTGGGGGGSSGGGGGEISGRGPAPEPSGGIISRIISAVKKIIRPGQALVGDLNLDGHVNIFDVSILLYSWQRQSDKRNVATISAIVLPSPDLNMDRRINISDLSILLSNWTR